MKFISKETIQKYSQTAGKRNEIDEIFEPVLLAQRIYGLQILNPEWTWKKYGIFRLTNFVFGCYLILGTINVCINATDLNSVIEGCFALVVISQMVVKGMLFVCKRKNLQRNYFKAKTYFYDLIKKSPEKQERLVGNLKLLKKILFFMVICPVSCHLIMALWFAFNGNRVTLSRSTSTLMPNTSPYYELGLLIHLHLLLEAAFSLLVVDLWFIFMCFFFFVASELSIEFLNVKQNGDSDNEYAKRLNDSLRKFYLLHVEMMEYLNLVNDMYKWICLVPIIGVLFLNSLFLMLLQEELSLQLFTAMIPAVFEMFAYNWFGEKICTTGDNINMALLHFDWTSLKLKDQKKYYILACYMNKKICIKTAIGNDLSLLTLSNIYKISYQMFTVFRST